MFLISPGPSADSPLRHAADLLGMAIGDDSGSRLYWALVDPGLADSADCSFHEYEGAGAFYTSFSCEPEQTQRQPAAIVRDVLQRRAATTVLPKRSCTRRSKVLSRWCAEANGPRDG